MTPTFRTHNGQTVTGDRLMAACKQVADDWRTLHKTIRKEDRYAAHVREQEKDEILQRNLKRADEIERGDLKTFTIWQRVNTVLTGECVALLGGNSAKI